MKINDLPNFAKKYKTKGYDVKKVGNEYYQYKVEHFRSEEKPYPITKFIYVGKIDKAKGLIPSNTEREDDVTCYLEYGLSNYLFTHYKRAIQRSLFNASGELANEIIKLGIIYYIFNEVNKVSLKSSYLTYKECDNLLTFYNNNPRNQIKIKKISNKIKSCLENVFINENDRKIVINSLRNMNAKITNKREKINKMLSNRAKEIFEKAGVKYE